MKFMKGEKMDFRPKEYLRQIEILKTIIEQKRIRAKEYRELALTSGGFDYSKEQVKSSNLGGQIESRVLRYVELESDIAEDIYKLNILKDQISAEIYNLDNANYIKILFKRYVECKNLKQVAQEMKYSYTHIRKEHGEALECFKKIKDDTK